MRLIHANRLTPAHNYAAAYGIGTELTSGKNNSPVVTTPTLKSYAQMFRSFFANEKNLFDAGATGINLGLPQIFPESIVTTVNQASDNISENLNKTNNPDTPHAKELDAFLKHERDALEHLRDLLTGHTELKGDELTNAIEEIARPREYLYLHFADGFKYKNEQSFLNRIRIEIDYFLKII